MFVRLAWEFCVVAGFNASVVLGGFSSTCIAAKRGAYDRRFTVFSQREPATSVELEQNPSRFSRWCIDDIGVNVRVKYYAISHFT